MKKLVFGLVAGLVLGLALSVNAASIGSSVDAVFPFFIDGTRCSVDAISIEGTSYIPVRKAGELFGYNVAFNNNQIYLTKGESTQTTIQSTSSQGTSRSDALPMGQSLTTPDGFQVSVSSSVDGSAAWNIAKEANMYNDPPDVGNKFILISVKVKNISSDKDPAYISDSDFKLVGSSNRVFTPFEKSLVLPDSGPYKEISGQVYHGGELSGGMHFQIPDNETNLVLIWDKPWTESDKRFFAIK